MLLLIAVACTPEVTFPEGLQSLAPDNQATWPAEGAEDIDVVGGVTDDDLIWAHARGYVHASLAEVWTALQDPDVVMDRGDVDEYEIIGSEEGFDVSFVTHCISYNVVTVEWDMAYRQSAVAGSVEEPEVVALRAEKTAGSEFFEVLTWSLHVREEEEALTSWEFVYQMLSIQKDSEPLEGFAQEFWIDAVATTHGDPLPDYSEE